MKLIAGVYGQMTVTLVSGGVGAAVFMAELGKNGNSHARWNKICDKFGKFCDQGGGALIASFVAVALLMIINMMSIIALRKQKPTIDSVAP